MVKKLMIFLMLIIVFSSNVYAAEDRKVEIFDINKGQVIKMVPLSSSIHKAASKCIQGITGIYAKFDPIPDKGYAVKIPLDPPVKVHNQLVDQLIENVIIIFPEEEGPKAFLVFFEENNQMACFTFKGNTDELLKSIKFKLDPLHGKVKKSE